jgi:hypothetical protein
LHRSVLAVGAAGVAIVGAAVLSFAYWTGQGPFTEMRCGTGPIEHVVPRSSWVVITEEYSCGVSSDWTEVRAVHVKTNTRLKLMSFDDIEEFSVRPTPRGIDLAASDIASVVCYRSDVDGFRVTYSFDPKAYRSVGMPSPEPSPCLSTV